MNAAFLDTSYLLALVLKRDALHDRATAWRAHATGMLLTTEYVLTEFVDALASSAVRRTAVEAVSLIWTRSTVRIVPASTGLWEEGLAFFQRHHDKRWSLTDCLSFVVMHREGVRDALTSDHHFEQAGFRALLREEPR